MALRHAQPQDYAQSECSSEEESEVDNISSESEDEPDEPFFSILLNQNALKGMDAHEFAIWKGRDRGDRQFTVQTQRQFFERVLRVRRRVCVKMSHSGALLFFHANICDRRMEAVELLIPSDAHYQGTKQTRTI
jgi:hypothetical protein